MLSRIARWAAVLAAALGIAWLWPASLGGCTTLVVVSGGSMEPTYSSGDLLVARCGDASVGDVVVYEPPTVPGARVVHRVVGGDPSGWVVQGDANAWLDPWTPGQEQVVGRVVAHLPGLGLTPLLLDPLLWAAVVVLGLGLLLLPARRAPAGQPGPAVPDGGRAPRRLPAAAAVVTVAGLVALAGFPEPASAARVSLAPPVLHAGTWPVDAPIVPVPGPAATGLDGPGFALVDAAPCDGLPVLVLTGVTGWDPGHAVVGPGTSRTVYLQGHAAPVGDLLACP